MQSANRPTAIPVTRLNHAVLYVRDLDRSAEFYRRAFGFQEFAREGGAMAFLRAAGSANHHDLALLRPPSRCTGGTRTGSSSR